MREGEHGGRTLSRRGLLRSGALAAGLGLAGCAEVSTTGNAPFGTGGDGNGSSVPAGNATDDAVGNGTITGTTTPTPSAAAYPTYRSDLGRTGHVAGPGPSAAPTELWRFDRPDPYHLFTTPPTVADGRVYVAGDNGLFALDAATGSQLWHRGLNEAHPQWGVGPTVADGVVYHCVDESPNAPDPDAMYAFDAATGTTEWISRPGERFMASAPAAVGDTVYVGSSDGNLYALDTATGTERWRFTTKGKVFSSPAVVDGTVYFGSQDEKVYAVDAASGSLVWARTVGGSTTGNGSAPSPVVTDGTVYVNGRSAPDATGRVSAVVHSLDAATGDPRWAFGASGGERFAWTGDAQKAALAVANGVVYVPLHWVRTEDGTTTAGARLYAVDDTGTPKWQFAVPNLSGPGVPPLVSPLVVGDTPYAVGLNGRIFALDPATGTEQWRYEVPDVRSELAVVGTTVFAAGNQEITALSG